MKATVNHNLVEVLLARSESTHGVNIVRGQDQLEHIPYRDMLLRSQYRLAQFQRMGLGCGSYLIIHTSDNALFLEAFWACLLGGLVAVPVATGNSEQHRHKLFNIADKLDGPGFYTDDATHERLSDFAQKRNLSTQFQRLSHRWIDCTKSSPSTLPENIVQAKPDDIAFIQFSSGSTSAPKGVVLTHENLIVNTQAIIAGCQMRESDHLFSWMPLTHDMGLIGFHLTPLVKDVGHTLMGTELFVRRPGLWLTESHKVGATMLCSPNFGYEHLLKSFKADKFENLNLSAVRLVFNGAEPISVSLCKRFMETLAPFGLSPDSMCPVYGLAEASLAVTFPDMDNRFNTITVDRRRVGVGENVRMMDVADTNEGIEFVSVGIPLNDIAVEIRGVIGPAYQDGVTGLIYIRGASVTSGYFKEPELNQAMITSDRWLNTGDLGFMYEGSLYVTGREKDIIFVNGQNVFPHDLEETIFLNNLVERGKLAIGSRRLAVDAGEELVAFVVHRGSPSELKDIGLKMASVLSEAAGVSLSSIVPVHRIPKTTSGKIQRFVLIEALECGEFDSVQRIQNKQSYAVDTVPVETVANEMAGKKPAATVDLLLQICNNQVEGGAVGVSDNLFELGISSLTLAQIHASIEEQWPERVDITDLFEYPSVKELAEFLDAEVLA